jgi:hypothetical protein
MFNQMTWFAAANVARLMLQKTHADKYAAAMQRTNYNCRVEAVRRAINGCDGDWQNAAKALQPTWFGDADDLPSILADSYAAVSACVGTMAYGSEVTADEVFGIRDYSCHASEAPQAAPAVDDDDDDSDDLTGDDDFPDLNV